jgi:XTP/dITP diphosphohydrolase
LGEDSGISVDALGGRPGVYSARHSGPDATDERNNARLLEELGDTPLEKRTAHYTCHIAMADPRGNVQATCEAICRGLIRFKPAGSNGFGYDPLFEIVEYHRTFGELSPVVKSVLSHRTRAISQLLPTLRQLLRHS